MSVRIKRIFNPTVIVLLLVAFLIDPILAAALAATLLGAYMLREWMPVHKAVRR